MSSRSRVLLNPQFYSEAMKLQPVFDMFAIVMTVIAVLFFGISLTVIAVNLEIAIRAALEIILLLAGAMFLFGFGLIRPELFLDKKRGLLQFVVGSVTSFMLILMAQSFSFMAGEKFLSGLEEFLNSPLGLTMFLAGAAVCEEMFFNFIFLLGVYYLTAGYRKEAPIYLVTVMAGLRGFIFAGFHYAVYGADMPFMVALAVSGIILSMSLWFTKMMGVPIAGHMLVNVVASLV